MIQERREFYMFLEERVLAFKSGTTIFYDTSKLSEPPSEQFLKAFMRATTGDKIAIGENVFRLEGLITVQVFTPKEFYEDHLDMVKVVYDAFKSYSASGRLRMQGVRITDLGEDPELPSVYSNVTASFMIDN